MIDEDGRETRVLHATGTGSDTMQRVTWDVTRFAGRRGRIRIVDASSGAGGRVSVDDIRFASVVVPNLIGRDEAEARRVLESRGLRAGTAGRVESRVAEGRVLTQTPRAGARVEPGAAVDLDVAEPARVTNPNLVGHDGQAAVRRLTAADLTPGRVRREESRQPEGTVLSQAPAAGQRTRIGTAVDLVVASPRTTQVPDLMGHDAGDAARLLAEADLRQGRVRQQESRQRTGTVLAQSPAAHTQAAADTAVDLVVAAPSRCACRTSWAAANAPPMPGWAGRSSGAGRPPRRSPGTRRGRSSPRSRARGSGPRPARPWTWWLRGP